MLSGPVALLTCIFCIFRNHFLETVMELRKSIKIRCFINVTEGFWKHDLKIFIKNICCSFTLEKVLFFYRSNQIYQYSLHIGYWYRKKNSTTFSISYKVLKVFIISFPSLFLNQSSVFCVFIPEFSDIPCLAFLSKMFLSYISLLVCLGILGYLEDDILEGSLSSISKIKLSFIQFHILLISVLQLVWTDLNKLQ